MAGDDTRRIDPKKDQGIILLAQANFSGGSGQRSSVSSQINQPSQVDNRPRRGTTPGGVGENPGLRQQPGAGGGTSGGGGGGRTSANGVRRDLDIGMAPNRPGATGSDGTQQNRLRILQNNVPKPQKKPAMQTVAYQPTVVMQERVVPAVTVRTMETGHQQIEMALAMLDDLEERFPRIAQSLELVPVRESISAFRKPGGKVGYTEQDAKDYASAMQNVMVAVDTLEKAGRDEAERGRIQEIREILNAVSSRLGVEVQMDIASVTVHHGRTIAAVDVSEVEVPGPGNIPIVSPARLRIK